VHLRDGVAHLAGASTIPEGRRRGAQLALLEHRPAIRRGERLRHRVDGRVARQRIERNAERHGFRIALHPSEVEAAVNKDGTQSPPRPQRTLSRNSLRALRALRSNVVFGHTRASRPTAEQR
jgi:hypothetical protein